MSKNGDGLSVETQLDILEMALLTVEMELEDISKTLTDINKEIDRLERLRDNG